MNVNKQKPFATCKFCNMFYILTHMQGANTFRFSSCSWCVCQNKIKYIKISFDCKRSYNSKEILYFYIYDTQRIPTLERWSGPVLLGVFFFVFAHFFAAPLVSHRALTEHLVVPLTPHLVCN